MKLGFQFSIAGHVALVAMTFLSWPVPDDQPEPVVVSVSLVTQAPEMPDETEPELSKPEAPPISLAPETPEPSDPPKTPKPEEVVPDPQNAKAPPPDAPKVSDKISVEPEAAPEVDTSAPSAQVLDPPPEPQNQEREERTPEQTTTQIVTEADAAQNKLPQLRPENLDTTLTAVEKPVPQPPAEPIDEGVSDALLNALQNEAEPAPASVPLTSVEKANFKLAVEGCWNVDIGSLAANIIVTVAFSLTPDGKVEASSVQMVSASGGPREAIQTAYASARRAILICSREGYDLPVEKYEAWKNVELTFDPSNMR